MRPFFLLASVVVFITEIGFAVPDPIDVSLIQPADTVGLSSLVYEDKTDTETIDSIVGQIGQFTPSKHQGFNFGMTKSSFWVHFSFINKEHETKEVFLLSGYPFVDQLDLYQFDPDDQLIVHKGGDHIPKNDHDVNHRLPTFKINLKPGVTKIFVRAKTLGAAQLELSLWDRASFDSKSTKEYLFLAFSYGMIVVMILYNLFLAISFKTNLTYWVYVFFITMQILQFGAVHGISAQLFPDRTWFMNTGYIFESNCGVAASTFFTILFLGLRKHHRYMYHFNLWVGIFGIVSALLAFVNYNLAALGGLLSGMLASFAVLGGCIVSCQRRFRPAYYFTLAWIALIIGNLVRNFSLWGFIPQSFISDWGTFIGVVAEIILLSLALGDRIKYVEDMAKKKIKDLNGNLQQQNKEISDLNQNLEQKVEEKTRDIRSILRNIQLGIFSIGRSDLKITGDYSTFMNELFPRRNIENEGALEVVCHGSDISQDMKSQIESTLAASIGEHEISFLANQHLLPSEMNYKQKDGSEKTYELEWNSVVEADTLIKVLVIVRDVTAVRLLQQKARDNQHELKLIGEIIAVKPEEFQRFVSLARDFIRENRKIISMAENKATNEDLKIIFINLHTLKGTARNYYFEALTEVLHLAERRVHSAQQKEEDWDFNGALEDLDAIEKVFDTYVVVSETKLGRKMDKSSDVEIDGMTLHKMTELATRAKADPRAVDELVATLHSLAYTPLEDVMLDLLKATDLLAKDLGKEKPKCKVKTSGTLVTAEAERALRNSFVHIIRNSMDHGIETAEERSQSRKDPCGTITLDVKEDANGVEIIYHDDGRGLHLGTIFSLAQVKGIIKRNASLSPQEIAEVIFADGFSTSHQVSEISGRGVGMSAIRAYMEEIGGSAKIILNSKESDAQGFYTFQLILKLPKNRYLMPERKAA